MSKRSSRRKRRQQQRQREVRLTGPVLAQQGFEAFNKADYEGAIKAWEQAIRKNDAPAGIPAALAEAYFRLSLTSSNESVRAMEEAVKQQPEDLLYRYHLALAYHREGKLEKAEPIYRDLLKLSPPFDRAAEPLAQLLIDQRKAVLRDPVWDMLKPEQQRQLAAAEALVKNKATSTVERLSEKDLAPIWQGLTALALNDSDTAQQQLKPLAESGRDVPRQTRNVARYYLGLLAVQAGQSDVALAHWQAVQNDGFSNRVFKNNLSVLAYNMALEARQANQPERAEQLLEQVRSTSGFHKDFRQLSQQLDWEVGYVAAQKGDWQRALSRWQRAKEAGDDSRRLVFNLALAYQHQEDYWQAAEHWRTVLRRRPRRSDHPDALNDQQVARIWQNVAENYSRAGEYDEAVTTYKNAVKWAPDNLDIRLKLVDALQSEGRWQAAENELNRILERDPDNVPALTLLAESYSEDYFKDKARELWRRILKLEPQNPVARQQLAQTFIEEGDRWIRWRGDYEQAMEHFKAGLEEVPDNQRLLTVIGGAYADWGKADLARDYLAKALAINPGDLLTLRNIIVIWLRNDSLPDMQQALERLQALTPPPPVQLFLEIAERCYQEDFNEISAEILDWIVENYSSDADAMVTVSQGFMDLGKDGRALAVLRQALKEQPDHIEANIELGTTYFYMDQTRLAKRHWDKASELARKANDHLMIHRIKTIKDQLLHGKRAPQSFAEMIRTLPPEALDQILKNAPPEVAAMLRNMPPEMLDMFAGFGGDDDDIINDPFAFDDIFGKRK